ncbi:pyocin knob domain-containing protein [Chryseobacterium sp. MHB01]|uniref:pyocin knob domain-containing protein n=1 Tax=Chryseobacterium sp. MHB01 TaxID=3109433 RepID=UPI002AFECA10|nr:pyocin knob domain-containing protein [Chryseobacterium sp. MHB01]MEA1848037.1 pyocin knob domain-containing protein [Chryseobacterium sp. MHB01]
MIAPEYFNNHIAVEGEIIVKGVPNDTGFVLVWNPLTKKISKRTHAEIVSDLSLMTTNTPQDVGGRKVFYVSGNSNPEDTTLWTYGTGGAKAGIVFYSSGMDAGKINFDGYFHFKNFNDTGYKGIVASEFRKANSDDGKVLLGGGGEKSISDFSVNSHTHDYLFKDGSYLADVHGLFENNKFKFITRVDQSSANLFPSKLNSNSILSIASHDGDYGNLLGFNSENQMFVKSISGGNWSGWEQIAYKSWVASQLNNLTGNYVPFNGASQNIDLNSKNISNVGHFQNSGSIISNNIALSAFAGSYGGYQSNPLIKIGARPGNMMTFTVKLYNYPHFFYEFQVNIYNYLGDVYEPTVTWKAGDSAHIDRIEFYKDPATGVFYIRPIIEVAYSRIAITDVQAYGGDDTFLSSSWDVVWGGDVTPLLLQYTILSTNFNGDSRVVNTHKEQLINARKDFNGATGNDYLGAALQLRGNGPANTIFPTIAFHQSGLYAGTVSYRGDAQGFYFTDVNGSGFENITARAFYKYGSDNGKVLLGGGDHKSLSDFWTPNNFNPNSYIPTSHPVYGINSTELGNWRHFAGYWDNRNIQPAHILPQNFQIGFTSWNNDNSYPYADYIHFGGYHDSSGGNQNLMVIKKNGFGLRQWQGSPQGVSSYQSYVDYWNTGDFTVTDIQNWKNNAAGITIVNEQDPANLFTKENKFMWINGGVTGAGGINSWVGNFISIGGNNLGHKSQLLISKNQLLFRGNHGNEDTAFNEVWHHLNLSKDEFVRLDDGKSSRAITGKDLNDLQETGFFRGSNLGNAPMGSPEWFFITSEYHYTGWASQTAATYGTAAQPNRMFKRTLVAASYWTDWVEIATSATLESTQHKKRTYFWQSPAYSGTMVNRIYLPTQNVADVTIKVGSSYHGAYAIGLIELELVYGINVGGGPWGAEAIVKEALGAVVERLYVDPVIKYDAAQDRPYINVHKFHPAENPIFIDVTVRCYSNDLKDDSVFFEEDTTTPVLDIKNQSYIASKLEYKANTSGDNAADTWRRDSLGLLSNPYIPGKTRNAGGDTGLLQATYGQIAGYINNEGTYNGNPNNNWWFRIKMLHNNSAGYYGEIGVQMTGGSNALAYKKMENGIDSGWVQVWDSQNLNPAVYVTQSSANSQLSGYATLAGVQTFTNTNTFAQSPVIPNGTLGAHAVNLNQLNGKANALENATGIGFSSGNYPSADGSQYPYIYFNNGGTQAYIALATQAYLQNNFLSTPDGTSVMIPGSDLNSYFKTGFYRGSGLANAPMNNGGWWYVAVETHDSTWVKQTATSYGSGNTPNITYQRTMVGGRWTAWVQIWTTADFTVSNIQQWNYAYQYGLKLNEEFTVLQNTGLVLADNYFGGESGIIDNQTTRLLAAKQNEYYFYGSGYDNFDGLNFECKYSLFGMGMPSNGKDKLVVKGSVKALNNFKSDKERPDTLFIPNGEIADLRDEIINDESEYAIRLDPHEYEIDQSGYLELNDRNRLIHIIGEYSKDMMVVNLREIYPKQQIVIYNFDHTGNGMEVRIQGNKVYNIESRCFLRLYVTNSLRVIAERLQPCDMIW